MISACILAVAFDYRTKTLLQKMLDIIIDYDN